MIVFILMLINTLLNAMASGIKPVVSLHASSLGITPAEISVIVAGYALLPAFLAVQIGMWTDKYGVRRIVMLGNGSLLIALFLGTIFPSFILFVLQQAIIGIGFTALMISLQKCAASTGRDVDKTIVNLMLAGSLGAMLGPLLSMPLYDYFGFQVSSYANILVIFVAFIGGFLISKTDWEGTVRTGEQGGKLTERSKGESIWLMMRQRNLRNAIIASGLVLSSRELFSAYFPLLAERMGISATMTGFLLALSGLTALIVRFSQPMLVCKFGRMNVLTWSLYISGLVYLLTPFSPWIVLLAILVGILGGGLGLGQPLSLAYAIQVSPPDRRGEVLGLRITFNRGSQFAIPLIFGGIGGLAGISAVFLASGFVLLFFGYLTRPLPSDKEHDQASWS